MKFYEYFEKTLASGKILKSHAFQKALSQIGNSLEDEEAFFAEIEKIELVSLTAEYDKPQMKRDIKEDLERLNALKLDLDRIPAYADRKLQALGELLAKDRVFENDGKKCLVFTQYMDTAEYIYRNLKEQMEMQGRKISILTGKTASKEREKIITAFAPKANKLQAGLVPETDLLISTDVLSEGQNLQDANYVINYDLPWNPMRIVQRVGRVRPDRQRIRNCDRRGLLAGECFR